MDLKYEQKLVKLAQSGDRAALGELWDAITPKLFGYLINTVRDKVLAEDLLQSTWLKAINALPKYKIQGTGISSWLFAIARNECRLHWRVASKESSVDLFAQDFADSSHEKNQQEILVMQVMSKLSREEQELLNLRYISGLSMAEIAKVLNINFVAARVRMHRAIAKARSQANF